jgi:WD40 repeat protein
MTGRGAETAFRAVAIGVAPVFLALAVRAVAEPPPGREPSLPQGALARLGTPYPRHDGPMQFLAFTPDGRSIVSLGIDGVRVWDAATERELRHFGREDAAEVANADLSPDGTLLATAHASAGGAASLWEVATGRLVREFEGAPRPSGWPRLRFSPDGKKLAAAFGPGTGIVVWDVATGRRALAWDAAAKRVWDVVFAPDGRRLFTGGDDGAIRVWDPENGKLLREIGAGLDEVGRLAVSPDGRRLASVSHHFVRSRRGFWQGDDFVRLWDAGTGELVRRLPVPAAETFAGYALGLNPLAFTPDGKHLLVAGADRAVRAFDAAGAAHVTRSEAGVPGLLAVSPDGHRLAVVPTVRQTVLLVTPGPVRSARILARFGLADFVSRDALSASFRVVALETDGRLDRPSAHAGGVVLNAPSPDGRLVATASSGPEILVWDAATGRELRRLAGHEGDVVALGWENEGHTLLSAGVDQTLRARDALTGKELRRLRVRGAVHFDWHAGPRGAAAFAPDGRELAVVDRGGGVVLTDAATGDELNSLGVRPGGANFVAYAPDGQTLLIGTTESFFNSWDTRAGEETGCYEIRDATLARYYLRVPASDVALSPDGTVLAGTRQDGTLVMVDTRSERVVRQVMRHKFGPARVAVSPDGHTLAWAPSTDGPEVVCYETDSGGERYRLQGHADTVLSLTYSADGRRLVSGSLDGTALVWDVSWRRRAGEGAPLTPADLDSCWEELAGDDAARAYRVIGRLAAHPQESVPFLRRNLPPVVPADENEIRRLIDGLDNGVRHDRALARLQELGDAPLQALEDATRDDNLSRDVRDGAGRAVIAHKRELTDPSPASRRQVRALEALELAGTAEAREALQQMARGEPGARRTRLAKAALARLKAPTERTGFAK